MKLAAKSADYVWIILMGNDALDRMPDCASTGKSADECSAQLYADMIPNMNTIVRRAAPAPAPPIAHGRRKH